MLTLFKQKRKRVSKYSHELMVAQNKVEKRIYTYKCTGRQGSDWAAGRVPAVVNVSLVCQRYTSITVSANCDSLPWRSIVTRHHLLVIIIKSTSYFLLGTDILLLA